MYNNKIELHVCMYVQYLCIYIHTFAPLFTATTHTALLSGVSTSMQHINVTANKFAINVCGFKDGNDALICGIRLRPQRIHAPNHIDRNHDYPYKHLYISKAFIYIQ